MMCTSPVRIHKESDTDHQGRLVPCGSCRQCRIKRRIEWTLRLVHESSYYTNSTFLTLTYSPENLPCYNTILKSDLQNYFKLLRKNIHPLRIKYFACGEYGKKEDRPHYHALVFGLSHNDPAFEYSWSKGFIHHGVVTPKSINYVCKYIDKAYSGNLRFDVYDSTFREVPFSLKSQGLGLRYCIDNQEQIINNKYISLFGTKHSIPRYYLNKLGLDSNDFKEYSTKQSIKFTERFLNISDCTLERALKTMNIRERASVETEMNSRLKQHDNNLKARLDLRPSGKL